MAIAIVNDRFDLANELLDLGADPNDGSLYFAVDMHDATTDMRARDGSRLRADHPNTLTALDLVKRLLDRGADPNKAFVGQLHSTTLCCGDDINASPFYRAAIASDVEALKLMLAHGRPGRMESSAAVEDGSGAPVVRAGRGEANAARRRSWWRWSEAVGPPSPPVPGFERLGPPPFREASNREPVDAVKTLLAAGCRSERQGARRVDAAASGGGGAPGRHHPRAGRRGREARCGQQGQPDAAAAGREARAAATAGQQHGFPRLEAEAGHARRRHCDVARVDASRPERSGAGSSRRRSRLATTKKPTARTSARGSQNQAGAAVAHDVGSALATVLGGADECASPVAHARRGRRPALPRRRRRAGPSGPAVSPAAGSSRTRPTGSDECGDASRVAEQVLRQLPQRPRAASGQRSAQPRHRQSRRRDRRCGHVGARAAKVERARHAAAGMPHPTEAEYAGFTHWLADVARSRAGRRGRIPGVTSCIG